jgi:adenine-specific DNA-methyltransferase
MTVWPLNSRGEESRWQLSPENLRAQLAEGNVRSEFSRNGKTLRLEYLSEGHRTKIAEGSIEVTGYDQNGAKIVRYRSSRQQQGKTIWNLDSHGATAYGTQLLRSLLGGRQFPFPKSLYAVEDTLRFALRDKPCAVVLDFFAGSGTTAHAVMRLNRQDGGRRRCILVTNNEVGADEQKALRQQGLRPGDPQWEQWGICEHITKPRVRAAITGLTPDGEPIQGDYKFTDEFPMAEGFAENAEFFTLTFESPVAVDHNLAFARIAPLLWLRAGSEGRRIDALPDAGFALADTYALLADLDAAAPFCAAVATAPGLRIAYIVTDDPGRFQAVARCLPAGVEPLRLYESYLTNFQFANGD